MRLWYENHVDSQHKTVSIACRQERISGDSMNHKTLFFALLILLPCSQQAMAAKYAYMIDHGTPGVITSASKMARIVLQGSGDCSSVPYEVITDGVKSLTGNMNLNKPLSMPLDLTTVTLSCSDAGIKAVIDD